MRASCSRRAAARRATYDWVYFGVIPRWASLRAVSPALAVGSGVQAAAAAGLHGLQLGAVRGAADPLHAALPPQLQSGKRASLPPAIPPVWCFWFSRVFAIPALLRLVAGVHGFHTVLG